MQTPRSEPHRVQQKRTKGWRKPENTVSVARPGRFGNPFKVGGGYAGFSHAAPGVVIRDRAHAVEYFKKWIECTPYGAVLERQARAELAGKNLMCFCPLDEPCHADVLLRIANGPVDV